MWLSDELLGEWPNVDEYWLAGLAMLERLTAVPELASGRAPDHVGERVAVRSIPPCAAGRTNLLVITPGGTDTIAFTCGGRAGSDRLAATGADSAQPLSAAAVALLLWAAAVLLAARIARRRRERRSRGTSGAMRSACRPGCEPLPSLCGSTSGVPA